MSFIIFLLMLLTAVITGFSYLVINNPQIILINAVISIIFCCFIGYIIWRYLSQKQRHLKMFDFIELIIFNLNVQKTIEATFVVIEPLLDLELQKKFNNLNEDNVLNKLNQLSKYFKHHYYDSFCELLNVTLERGGNVLKTSEVLLTSIRGTRAHLNNLTTIDNNYLAKFCVNWIFIMIVVLAFKKALNNVFEYMTTNTFFVVGIEIFLVIFLISIFLVINNRVRTSKNVN